MKVLKEKASNAAIPEYGPDPVLMKKIGARDYRSRDLSYYKKKIKDREYMDHAINRIAMELSHFLSR